MKTEHENHSKTGQQAEDKPALPEQQNSAADVKDADKTGMSGMSAEEHAKMMPEMSPEEHAKMMQDKPAGKNSEKMSHDLMSGMSGMTMGGGHEQMMWRDSLWASFVNLLLGAWLMASPPTLGYSGATAAATNDYISGALIIILAALAFVPRLNTYARWAICFVGIWLLFAPLVFWTPSAADYMNDTLVGALVIAFAVLVTMMPGMDMSVMDKGDVPPGWSYNPSSWLQRAPIILLALVGLLASRYMAAYQLDHIPGVFDPFFADGTRRVLDSDISKMFPISDAGLGAVAYMLEILMGFMGDRARWRTMPWMVTFFGILVVPLGVTSIVLIILQPLAVGAWCSLCLLAAIAMVIMIPATLDEVVAMIQFLIQSKREGKSLWRTFWFGGTVEGSEKDDRLTPFDWSKPQTMFVPWLAGNWHLLVVAGLGVWLMFAPWFFGSVGRAADSDHLVGALIVTFAVIAIAEAGRAARFINILFGAWLAVAPLLLSGYGAGAGWSSAIAGMFVIVFSFRRGKIRGEYAGWNRYIR